MLMKPWFWYAVVAADLYGAHQIFTRMPSDHIGDGIGGFVVEGTAALTILLYLAFLYFAGRWNQKFSSEGFCYSALTGVCVGAGTVAFSSAAARCRPCPSFSPVARPSWPLAASSSFTNRHHGSAFSASVWLSPGFSCYDANPIPQQREHRLSMLHASLCASWSSRISRTVNSLMLLCVRLKTG